MVHWLCLLPVASVSFIFGLIVMACLAAAGRADEDLERCLDSMAAHLVDGDD